MKMRRAMWRRHCPAALTYRDTIAANGRMTIAAAAPISRLSASHTTHRAASVTAKSARARVRSPSFASGTSRRITTYHHAATKPKGISDQIATSGGVAPALVALTHATDHSPATNGTTHNAAWLYS